MLFSLFVLFVFFTVLPAFVPDTSPYRHSICLVSLSFFITLLAIFFLPVFIWRPCNTRNFRLIWYVMHAYSQILGMDYHFENEGVLKKVKKYIIISNHQSYFDAVGIPLIAGFAENMAVISTNGVKYLGPMGLASKLAGFIFVKRFKGGAGYPSLKKQVEQLFSTEESACIFIFPEGGIGPGTELLKFKSGPFRLAAELDTPLLPMVISKYDISTDETIFRRGKVLAEFMEPIYVKEEDIERLKVETRDLMQKKFDELNARIQAKNPKFFM